MSAIKDLTGQRFGRLTVVKRHIPNVRGHVTWECVCDCGNTHLASTSCLTGNKTLSCGCLRREQASRIHKLVVPKHGGSKTRLYSIWRNMKSRCNCKTATKYNIYGGKGIKVCDEWVAFEGFRNWALLNGYSENLSLDRIDGSGNYCPKNCRWVTAKEQANNTSQNRILEYNNKAQTMAQWAEEFQMPYKILSERLRRNWSLERAFTTQVKRRASKSSWLSNGDVSENSKSLCFRLQKTVCFCSVWWRKNLYSGIYCWKLPTQRQYGLVLGSS